MIEEHAQVVAIDNSLVWVEAQRSSYCSRCAAGKRCGNAVFQKLFGKKINVFPVFNENETNKQTLNVGDEVVIGVEENSLVKNSFVVYVLPILSIIVFAGIGETFLKEALSISKDMASAIGALVGLLVSIIGLRWYNRLSVNKTNGQPVLLRRVSKEPKLMDIKILS